MSVTQQLLDLFNVDKQLRGLRSRLENAERFLNQQQGLLSDMEKQKVTLETQLKQLQAVIANYEGESARIEARMASLREQMNSAKTAKEYNAFLTELNNLKTQKSEFEERGLESVTKAEEIQKTLAVINAQFGERSGIVKTARTERDSHASEIKDKVTELQGKRDAVAAAVPNRERQMLESLIKLRGDEAMAPIEVIDRRAHEYSCSSCMMAVTVEVVSAVLSGRVAHCPSCRCLLFADTETHADDGKPAKKPKKAPAKKKAGKGKADAAADAGNSAEAEAASTQS